jgi:type II secretory pathway pseudopilin PulG
MKIETIARNSSGQTLVEAIVVIGLVVLLVTGLISGTTGSMRSSQNVRARSEATKYASEGVELLRIMRDTNWTTFSAYNGGFCFGSDGALTSIPPEPLTCGTNITTETNKLMRTVTFSLPSPGTVQVNVSVYYQDGSTERSVHLDTYFTDWKSK